MYLAELADAAQAVPKDEMPAWLAIIVFVALTAFLGYRKIAEIVERDRAIARQESITQANVSHNVSESV